MVHVALEQREREQVGPAVLRYPGGNGGLLGHAEVRQRHADVGVVFASHQELELNVREVGLVLQFYVEADQSQKIETMLGQKRTKPRKKQLSIPKLLKQNSRVAGLTPSCCSRTCWSSA